MTKIANLSKTHPMKLKITKVETEEKPVDGKPKKIKIKGGKNQTKNQYGIYSGIIGADGKPVDNPTELETVKTMANYMRNNQSDQSSSPSNVYRPKFSHLGLLYNKNTKKKNENQS